MMPRVKPTLSRAARELRVPPAHDWRTTDQDEVNKRILRARTEPLRITNTDATQPIFSNFRVHSRSGMTYTVEVRDVRQRAFACDCPDFRNNGLATCKHVESVLLHLQTKQGQRFAVAREKGSDRIDIVPDRVLGTLRVERGLKRMPSHLRFLFDDNGLLRDGEPDKVVELLRQDGPDELRVSQEVAPWIEEQRRAEERKVLRRQYESKVQSGEWPAHETLVPLFPYQREGMLHLAFNERALLADEMGLGKTIQAIAACALLHRLGKARRVLVVTPASLKTEWEEQIQRFTPLPYQLVFGNHAARLQAYAKAPFFTIVNYEQMVRDSLDVNARLAPDVVVLDEAQRIKNWNTQTAQAIKRLRSRYAFVLTGTPIENRIDELYSLLDFLNPSVLGPLFRFNREFYELDDRGKAVGYRNLDKLHARIKPYLLRRRKADVETELPERSDRTFFVQLSEQQQAAYDEHQTAVSRLVHLAQRRPLSQQEQDKLMRELAMMRMVCDTNYILDEDERECPKLAELEKLLEECRDNPEVKVIVFSEWERMLKLVRELCERLRIGTAWHTGSVPQRKRRDEINRFKNDAACRVFLSTDSGSTGLNLQNASVVINCDLPWNPAKLEQRIARAWRKHQTRSVTVINLVSENTIEHRMMGTLAAKQALAEGVLHLTGDLKEIKLTSGRQSFLSRIEQVMGTKRADAAGTGETKKTKAPSDRPRAFAERVAELLRGTLMRCEERFPSEGSHSVVVAVVERDAALWQDKLRGLHQELIADAPVRLEVIDRATDDAINRLIEAGLITRTMRGARSLLPGSEGGKTALTESEKMKVGMSRQKAARKLKMARLLATEELFEESREAMSQSIHALGCALAIENRLPEPSDAREALRAPQPLGWNEAVEEFRLYLDDPARAWKPVSERLETLLSAP